MRLTLPQIIMLNHAAWKEQKEADARAEARHREREEGKENPLWGSTRISDLKNDDSKMDAYMTQLCMNGFGVD